jgi:hypothetical protein
MTESVGEIGVDEIDKDDDDDDEDDGVAGTKIGFIAESEVGDVEFPIISESWLVSTS